LTRRIVAEDKFEPERPTVMSTKILNFVKKLFQFFKKNLNNKSVWFLELKKYEKIRSKKTGSLLRKRLD
jgi:hypothetical protein